MNKNSHRKQNTKENIQQNKNRYKEKVPVLKIRLKPHFLTSVEGGEERNKTV